MTKFILSLIFLVFISSNIEVSYLFIIPRNFIYATYRVNVNLLNSEVKLFVMQSASVTKLRDAYLLMCCAV